MVYRNSAAARYSQIIIAKSLKRWYWARPTGFDTEIAVLRRRVAAGETKVKVARDYGISSDTLYEYLRKV